MNAASPPAPFTVTDLGTMPYRGAWALQKQRHAAVAAGARPELLLVEHPPVLTLGRSAREGGNVLAPRALLETHGIEVIEVERGGDVTYHGPGQLVAYPIFPVGRRVRDFLRLLEAATVSALGELGLPDARPNPGYAGVYLSERTEQGRIGHGRTVAQKIASIGVAVKQHVALHGVGLNVATDLSHFDLIRPCGLSDTAMTSVAREYALREMQRRATMEGAKAALTRAFFDTFATYDWSLTASVATPPQPRSNDVPSRPPQEAP